MITKGCVAAVAAVLVTVAAAEGLTPLARPSFRNVAADARAEIARMAKFGAIWRPHESRTKMFIRGQFYYGNQLSNYIHAWYERPLHQDSSMAVCNEPGRMLNELSWKRTVRTAREMKLDGFAFFPMNPGCMDVFPRSVMPGGEVPILMQFDLLNLRRDFARCLRLAEQYRTAPNAYRIDGKPVVVGFPDLFTTSVSELARWEEYRRKLIEKYGENAFVIMPSVRIFDMNDLDRPELTLAAIERAKDRIRDVLRKMDGLFISQWEVNWGDPANLSVPTDEIVTPLVRGVLAEPEFRNKYLGYEFYQAHENPYRRFADLSSGGLVRLKSALDSIEKLRPDFAFGSEWDEENENVHFRPTVSNGQTTQRLMRYYADRASGTVPSPYPGDDVSVPNLIVCYRKTLALGEPVEIQVANVPDGSPAEVLQVSARWMTADGRVVREFPSRELSTEDCQLISFPCSSLDLVDHRILKPEIVVRSSDGKERTFSDGFWPMTVEAIRALDPKWVRHALREICTGVSGTLEIGAKASDGTYEVRGTVKGPKKYRSIEVLETSDTVYMHDPTVPTTNDTISVYVSFSALNSFWKSCCATGWVRLVHAPHAKRYASNPAWALPGGTLEWKLPKRSNPRENFFTSYGFHIPLAEMAGAELEIGLPQVIGVKRVRVADVVNRGPTSFGLPGGGQAVVKWDWRIKRIPPPANVESAAFSFRMKPLDPTAVLRLQVVDEDYRIWRGPVATFYRPSGKNRTFHFYDETTMRAAEATVDRNRLYALKYDFGKSWNDMADTVGGRSDSPCVFGGGIGGVTGVGYGGCSYQHALSEGNPDFTKKPGGCDTVPRCVCEPDGSCSLAFTNSNFATLPMQFVPRHAGFELSMRILPDRTDGVRWLLDSGNVGFQLKLRDGVPEAFLSFCDDMFRKGVNESAGITVKGLSLKRGVWNDFRLVFDQREAWIEVNGERGESVAGHGHEFNPHITAFGCSLGGSGFFSGRIAGLKVVPR